MIINIHKNYKGEHRSGEVLQAAANMLFSTFILLSTLFTVNALTLEERAKAKYHQKSSGSASFTVYSNCGAGGDDNHCSHLGRPVTEFFDNHSLRRSGKWVLGSNKPICLWCRTRRWAWRCLRSLFLFDRHWWPIFARIYWPFPHHCGQGE